MVHALCAFREWSRRDAKKCRLFSHPDNSRDEAIFIISLTS